MSGIHRWCTQCPIEARDVDNLQPETWPARLTGDEHRRLASEWRDLDSKGQARHFAKHGIRWSELLRLPYYDAVQFTAIEFSHNLLTNNADHLLRDVWGMNSLYADGLGDKERPAPKKPKELHPLDVEHAWNVVLGGTKKALNLLPNCLLMECCRRAGLGTGGRKNILIQKLLDAVRSFLKPHQTRLKDYLRGWGVVWSMMKVTPSFRCKKLEQTTRRRITSYIERKQFWPMRRA